MQGSNPRKRVHQNFVKKMRSVNIVLQIHKCRQYCGRFTEIVALKTSGLKPPEKYLESRPFHLGEIRFLIQRGNYKRALFSFAEKGMDLDPRTPLVARL